MIEETFRVNPLVWGMYYFEKHFRSESPGFHLKILKEAMVTRRFAVAAPRESAKSTILTFLLGSHAIAFKRKKFVVIVQNTYGKAAGSLETIKLELRDNEKFRRDFGVVVRKDSQGDSVFRHGDGSEVRVLCKGAEQIGSVRGEKFGAYRPDLIIIDDLEDDEMVANPDRRVELKSLYDEALIPSGDAQNLTVYAIGTILHYDSLMAKLVSREYYPEYRKLLFRARNKDKDGKMYSLWPEKWSLDKLNELERMKPDVFAKEYQNDPSSGIMGQFKSEDCRYWTIDHLNYVLFDDEGKVTARGPLSDCRGAIACDLAWSEKSTADDSVIMPGFLTPQKDLLVETYICKKGLRPDELEEILFPMAERLKALTGDAVPVGTEKAHFEKVAKWFIQRSDRHKNNPLWFKELEWDRDKIKRISTRLTARYAQHMVYHRKGMGDLESQLIRFPSDVHDDLADAVQGLVQLLAYPKSVKQETRGLDAFTFWQKQTPKWKEKDKRGYVFGRREERESVVNPRQGIQIIKK